MLGDSTCSPADAGQGPDCGSPEGRCWLRVSYADAGQVAWLEERYCCIRHIPDMGSLLHTGQAWLSLAVIDGLTMTLILPNGETQTFLNASDLPAPTSADDDNWPVTGPSVLVSFKNAA